ncbi:MAG: efflux RND transporter periplasmic adaptor subunit [Burkholderiales bacterium]
MKAEPQSETSMVSSKVAKLDLLVSDVERASRRRASFPILTVVLVVLAACGGSLVTWWIAGNSGPPVTAPPDSIAKPAPTPAIVADAPVELTGYFVAQEATQVTSTVVARVRRFFVKEGDSVKRGQDLVELENVRGETDKDAIRARLQSYRAQVNRYTEESGQLTKQVARYELLQKQGFVSIRQLEELSSSLQQALANLETARQNVVEAEALLRGQSREQDNYTVRAPFDGLIVSRNAQVGEVVSPISTASYVRSGLLTLMNPASIRVEVDIQERLLDRVLAAKCIEVKTVASLDSKNTTARYAIERIGSIADRARGTVHIVLKPVEPIAKNIIPDTSAAVRFNFASAHC